MVQNKFLVFGALILILILFFIPLLLKDHEIEFGSKNKEEAHYNLENVQLVGLKDGEKQWILQVKTVIDQGKAKTILQGLDHGELYEDGDAKYFLSADNGEYNRRTEDFTLISNVQVTTTDGEKILTDELYYNHLKKEMSGDGVAVTRENTSLLAQKMTVDVDEEVYEFLGSVEMELIIDEEDDESQEKDGGVGDEE